MGVRKLEDSEITALERKGCTASDWSKLEVTEPFQMDRIQNVRFSGKVAIGRLAKNIAFPGGAEKPAGLYNCSIHNCSLGDNVFVLNVGSLANYNIANDVVIENVGSLVVERTSSFGNGIELEVLNEAGGRSLKMYDRLSAQIAYLMVLYRHKPEMIAKLETMIDSYVGNKTSDRGFIGQECRIVDTHMIRNCLIGQQASISGALRLEEGTIAGSVEDPVLVGEGVIATNFIILSGSHVESAVVLENCFVGQGVRLGKQFSAENSAFFANCEGFHSEACALFAGPYTVTHHKSSLLIAGLLSFFNAGSGTNQSNHMYKLGPVHQGIMERGCKTGSFSYLLWPSRTAPFSVILGKHGGNFDASEFPFSYIHEEDGRSILTPAMNLFTVGTRRDSIKWPTRDRRKDPEKLDLINFTLLNPHIVQKMVEGRDILLELYADTPKDKEFVTHKGVQIRRLLLKPGARYYEMCIKVFMGDCLIKHLESGKKITEAASLPEMAGKSAWVDICGLVAPAGAIEKLLDEISTNRINDLDNLTIELGKIHAEYSEYEWSWCLSLIEERLGIKRDKINKEQLAQIIRDWKENSIKLNNMIAKDAMKEFDSLARLGYGINGNTEVRDLDFAAVRGAYEENPFIMQMDEDKVEIEKKAEKMLADLDMQLQ